MDLKLRFLSEASEPTVSELGGKGRSLAFLANRGFNVPRGFIVPSFVFQTFIEENGFTDILQKRISDIGGSNLKDISEELKAIILGGRIPRAVTSSIREGLDKLAVEHVAIRSSAVSEDSQKASFAGLYDSFLNIPPRIDLVLDCIKRCWASLFNERAMRYRLKRGLPYLEGMAVIVQEMILPTVAGTAFTTHPDAKDKDLMVIEATWGLGEALVSGSITPDQYTINKLDLIITNKILGSKHLMILPSKNGTKLAKTPVREKDTFCLDDEMVISLARLCLETEKLFGYPQDVEWCIDDRAIWMLQSRPITTLEVNK